MDLLKRYQRDGSSNARAALLEAYRPLVGSVCRRYLHHEADVEDAVQGVFAKMVRHIEAVDGGPVAWLTATAHSTCVDMIRRAVRERRRVDGLASQRRAGQDAERLSAAAKLSQLEAALRAIDGPSRELIVERFFNRTALRVIAGREGTSVATVSRRVSSVLDELKLVMGIAERDEGCLDGGAGVSCGGEGLRFAADWQSVGLRHDAASPALLGRSFRPGWTRAIRVGALVSHLGAITPSSQGFYYPVEMQLAWSEHVGDAGFDVVGIVEPGSSNIGHIERAVREFELSAGLIEGTDRAALGTLDVIVIPPAFAVRHDVLEAICEAVAGGVGLYNQWWKGHWDEREVHSRLMQVMLSATPIGLYHTPEGHGWPRAATVREEHPVIAGLGRQTPVLIHGCGPLYRPVESARVLISKDDLVQAPGVLEFGPARVPVLLAGQIGRGRVIVDHQGLPPRVAMHPALGGRFWTNVIEWLAAPGCQGA